jgi:CBS domain containing-hemolysin-like protein
MNGILVGLLVVALAMAALLSGMEAGVFALSRYRIRRLAREGDRRALRLHKYLEQPENFLWTILVGNTLAAWVVITLVGLGLQRRLGERPLLFMTCVVGVLLLLYVFADLLPKLLFRRFPNRLSLAGVSPFRFVHVALSPIVDATEWVSQLFLRLSGKPFQSARLLGNRAELRYAIKESATSLSPEELEMINRIMDLRNLRIRDVMTPIERAATLDAAATVGDLLELVQQRQVSFVPLWEDSGPQRRILGVVALSSVLYGGPPDTSRPLEQLVQPALFVGEKTRFEDALRVMQRGRQRLAIVLNAQRAESGVVTLNDILRAMFGEVRI